MKADTSQWLRDKMQMVFALPRDLLDGAPASQTSHLEENVHMSVWLLLQAQQLPPFY